MTSAPIEANVPELKSYPVWDAPTRWFHWVNALCVLVLASVGVVLLNDKALGVSNPGKVNLKTIHVWIGYLLAANLLWRFVWAFLGNQYASWRSILPGGRGYVHAVRSYVSAFVAGRPLQYVGHNPVARLGIAILLVLLVIQMTTGLVLAGTDLFYPPLGHWIAQWVAAPGVDPGTLIPYAPELYNKTAYDEMRAFREPYETIHLYTFYALLVVVLLHVAAVVITEIREGGSIISAMFTGRKIIAGRPVDDDERGGERR
ncbi:MAG: cytochrome b/b6 domain-containing protein [Nitrospirota bacterium]